MAYPMQSEGPGTLASREAPDVGAAGLAPADLGASPAALPWLGLAGADQPQADAQAGAASRLVRQVLDEATLEQLVEQMRGEGMRLTGPGGFLTEMLKAVLEQGLAAELREHLGYDKQEAAGRAAGTRATAAHPRRC